MIQRQIFLSIYYLNETFKQFLNYKIFPTQKRKEMENNNVPK